MLATRAIEFPAWLGRRAAAAGPVRALVAGGHSPTVLAGVRDAMAAGWLEPVLVGPVAATKAAADACGWDPGACEMVAAADEAAIAETVVGLAGPEAGPGIGMVIKGHMHTGVLMRALLRPEAGIRTGRPLVHVWLLTHPEFERPLAVSDGAFNVAPDMATRLAMVENLVALFVALGRGDRRARIALLAATEEVVPGMPATVAAAELADRVAAAGIDAEVFGPVAMDAAISPEAARIKGMAPPAGQADALIVPAIETGNVLVKTLIWFRSVCAAGVVLGGRIPVTITSRSDAPAARLASVALARIMAPTGEEPPTENRGAGG